MKIKIRVISTGHYEDRGSDSFVLVFANDETDAEQVEAMAELYYLDEDEQGNKVPLPELLTWEWLADEIEMLAWWSTDEREIEIDVKQPESEIPDLDVETLRETAHKEMEIARLMGASDEPEKAWLIFTEKLVDLIDGYLDGVEVHRV